ncbi:RHS repeat domain-containing protein [Oceanicoccus sagamiensis]|uniref:Teneurin-like YD-shell domain-containing protein n=1 Tax=Oceanicoccus sagamiensis TaxID=716816 RepID=A0A1X9NDG6_9GAMM|nr:RHS repeat-associated core domain-containing protein [Oceanicoccus sagamiensis]ARN75201.1 hypothetical protein BST96_14400 [Oceanicoccus sagamiensis]
MKSNLNKRVFRVLLSAFIIIIAMPASRAESELYFIHSDHRGAPVAMTDANQEVVWTASYTPFGEAEVDEDPDGDGKRVEMNLRLPGQYYDKERGLYYNYYRDYDPSLGRYIQADPRGVSVDFSDPQRTLAIQLGIAKPSFSDVQMINHNYAYVASNPLKYVDPTGEILQYIIPAIGIGTAIVSAKQCSDAVDKDLGADRKREGDWKKCFSGDHSACSRANQERAEDRRRFFEETAPAIMEAGKAASSVTNDPTQMKGPPN